MIYASGRLNRSARDETATEENDESPAGRHSFRTTGRARTFTDMKAFMQHANSLQDSKQGPLTQPRVSVDRREKIESGSLDLSNKLAALTDNWSSIKHSDLEVIKEYVPDKTAPQKSSLQQPKSTTAMANRKEALLKKDKEIRDVAPAKLKPFNMGTPKQKTVPAPQPPRAARTTNFDISKAMDELDQIKKNVSLSSQLKAPLAAKLSDDQLGEDYKEPNVASNREISDKEQEKKHKLESLAARRATHQATRKVPDSNALQPTGSSRHNVLMKNKKAMEDIETAFNVAIRKVQEFQRDTGSHIRLNEFNKEYTKLLDALRDVVKKS